MPESRDQLDLLRTENPLPEKLGAAFWDVIPYAPGVYGFYDADGNMLYAGKSRNLRARLFSYKNAGKTSVSRKIIRLIRLTEEIRWDRCKNETEALLEENRLIRTYKPAFNSANKEPETYYFIRLLRPETTDIRIELRMSVPENDAGVCYGAFKGHEPVRRALGAVNRTLYLLSSSFLPGAAYPGSLTRALTPRTYQHRFDTPADYIWQTLHLFFSGEANHLSGLRAQMSEEFSRRSLFEQSCFDDDSEIIHSFFDRMCRFNYIVRRELNMPGTLLPQQEFDDFLVERDTYTGLSLKY